MNFEWIIQHHSMRAVYHDDQVKRDPRAESAARHSRQRDLHREAVAFLLAQEIIVQAYHSLEQRHENAR